MHNIAARLPIFHWTDHYYHRRRAPISVACYDGNHFGGKTPPIPRPGIDPELSPGDPDSARRSSSRGWLASR